MPLPRVALLCAAVAVPALVAADPTIRWVSTAAPSRCITAFGRTTCGWDCLVESNGAECATWPGGTCVAFNGRVVCGPEAPAGWQFSERTPKAECRVASDRVACGYHCLAKYGAVACAATPHGRCAAKLGRVACREPGQPSPWYPLD